MNLSRRERIIGLLCIAVLGLLVLDSWVITPVYSLYVADVELFDELSETARADEFLYSRSEIINSEWKKRQSAGLALAVTEAENKLLGSLESWGDLSGLDITVMRSQRDQADNDLQEIICHVTAVASMDSLSEFLWLAHSSDAPVKIEDMKIVCSDNTSARLTVQMQVSTLTLVSDGAKEAKR